MSRNITVTFGDGSTHVYQNAPDTLTPQDVAARAASDFSGRAVTNIDGGNPAPPAAAPAPSLMDSVVGTIKSAASSVADAASTVAGGVKSVVTTIGHGLDQGDAATTGTPTPPPLVPPPLSHGDMIDAASAGGIPIGPPAPVTKPAIPHTEAVAVDQAEARRKYWDDVPDGTFKSGYFQGTMPMAKAAGTAMQSVGDAVGSDALANYGAKFRSIAGQHLDRALEGNRDNLTASVIGNVVGLLPALTGSGGIAAMVGTSAANGYSEALDAGDTTAQAVARGTALGLANYVGMRVQVPGLTGALTKAVSGAPAGEAIAALGHALSTNVGGMEATTVLSDLYDKMAPGGLRPNMTAADLVGDIADTAKSAALLTVAMPGMPMAAGHLFHAAHSLAHGDGNAEAARAIDSANPPAADATPTTTADATASAPILAGPIGLDTLHDSIDETARTVGLSPKATAALRDAAAQRDPQDAAAFVARAFHRMEANGLTTKAGAPGAFRDALAQRVADQQPEPPPAPKGKPSGKPSAADQLAAIRPLDQTPAPAPEATPADAAPAPVEPTPITPEAMAQANDIAGAAHQAATSPFNDTPEPTDAQKAAGNYKVGRVQLHGLDISIENPQGSTRSGVDPDGKPWQNEMAAHYGYIRGTHASDGDHVDTFIGPNPESKTAYVIDQVDPATGKFDEPKTILGADSEQQARELYAKNYADGWNGLGAITPLPMDAFKAWVRDGVKSKPLGDISTWKATDERAQPDVEKPAALPSGAGDGGGGPAVASGGDLGQDAALAAGRGVGGDATAPAGGAGAAAAVDAGGGADTALKPAPRLLGKAVTDYETPALQKIASMKASSQRARDVATAELSRRAAATPPPAGRAAPSGAAKHPATVQGSRLLSLVSKNLGGLDPAWLGEFSSKQETKRLGADGRPITQWKNPLIPGVGKLFRRGGTQDLESIANMLEEHHYLPPGTVERDPHAAGQQAQDIIRAALNRVEAKTLDEQQAEDEAARNAEADAHYAALDAASAREAEAERQAMFEAHNIDPSAFDRLMTDEDVAHGVPDISDHQALADFLGITPEELDNERRSQESTGLAGEDRAGPEAGSDAAGAAQPADEARGASTRPPGEGDSEGLKLSAQTPADLKAKAGRESAARAADAAEQKRLANKAAADAQRGDFKLTGSDRAADEAAANGQQPLLKQSDKPRAGIDPAALRTEVARIQTGWKDAPPVHVVDDVNGLPGHIQDSLRSMGAEGKTRALLMPGRGSDPGDVYLIASRLKDLPMAQAALFHEVLGHYGIRKVLGSDAIYSAEMYKLRQANPALASEAEVWMQRFGRGAIAARMERGLTMDQAVKVVRALSTEEALADRAGRGDPIRGLQSLMAKIQAWLRSVGLDSVADHLEKMTQAETAALLARARRAVEADAGGGHNAGDLAPALSQRDEAPNELPDAVIGHPLATATTHPDYAAAKGGDPVAAHRLAEDLVTPQFVESVRKSIGKKNVIVQGVNSIEASGRNKIPLAVAQVLAHRLGAESANDIAQSTSPKRTSMDGLERLLRSPEFDGPVRTDKPYLLLDDTLTQGGTMAALASHIRQNGGRVAGEVALTGKDYSRKIALSPDLLSQVRERYASVEPDFRAATGYGFDALTESEARYLVKRSAPDAVRARIVEAGEQARRLADSGVDQETRASLSQRSSDAGGIGVAEGGRASSERIREGLLRPAEGAADGDAPLLSQHAADDAATPDAPKSHVADALAKVREATAEFASKAKAIRDDALLKTVPMSLGTPETRTIAKDFANADRLASWQWGKFDDVLTKNYDEAQRRDMFNASDEQSVLLQQGKKVGADEGLNSLSPDDRKTVETLQGYGDSLLQRARDTGMFEGEGIPSWTPRMAVMVDGRGGFTRPKGAGAETGAKQGRNIVTTASSLKARKYLTSAETEAAMKGKLGDGAQLVRDIRVMPLAMARLEKAIAGRELINQIKAMGDRAGLETVSSSEKDGFFTVDHPAFKTWQATTSEDGTKSWEAKPLYVNKAFEGPLKAVMSETPGPVYSALMALKAKSMGLIMYSPLIHNAVEWGRALPAMPGKVATFRIYFEGNRIKNDPAQMRQAIKDGLVPIGKRGGIQDITGIMEDPSLTPGRSWTAKLIGGALGIAEPVSKPVARAAGTAVGTIAKPVGKAVQALGAHRVGGAIAKTGEGIAALGTEVGVKKAIDAAGDFWHNTLLWDRVGDLQAGLYGAMREKEIQKGVDPAVAGKLAAHFANRFAGALPNEAMSAGARKVANLLMFSRTFTLGNLGLMKDMITGLPRDIQAQIRTASGDLAAAAATSRARRIAIASFIVDIGLMYMGNSLMQDAIKKMKGDKTWSEIGRGYAERLHKLLERTGDHPLDTLSNPFDVMNSLSSTSENEPGKEDRIRVGTQDDGTAIYVRLPTGKVGEDFKNWITKPLITAKAKESQLVRPLQAIWNNDNGIGQRIYDPDAKGIGGVLTNAGRIAKLFVTQMVPTDAIKGAMDWEGGKASTVDKLKVAGPLVGLTFSKGAPGGPEIGEMYDVDRRHLGAKMDVMPDVKAAIKAGDDEKAVSLMEGIKMTGPEINSTLRRLKVPESRLNAGAFRKFSQHASDEDMARMMQLLQGEHPAAAPAPAPEPAEEATP